MLENSPVQLCSGVDQMLSLSTLCLRQFQAETKTAAKTWGSSSLIASSYTTEQALLSSLSTILEKTQREVREVGRAYARLQMQRLRLYEMEILGLLPSQK